MQLMNRKGQGTLEYLVILAVVLIIAIVVATQVLKIGNTQQINEQDSRLYWSTATPISIPQYAVTSAGVQLVLQNNTVETITISEFKLGATAIISEATNIGPNGKKTISSTSVKCTKGEAFNYKVNFTYTTESLTNPIPFEGQKNLAGNCAG